MFHLPLDHFKTTNLKVSDSQSYIIEFKRVHFRIVNSSLHQIRSRKKARSKHTTSLQRRCIDVVATLCVCWAYELRREVNALRTMQCVLPALQRDHMSSSSAEVFPWPDTYVSERHRFWRDCASLPKSLLFAYIITDHDAVHVCMSIFTACLFFFKGH